MITAGATHDLAEMIWAKRPVITDPRARYNLTFHDSSGRVELQLYDLKMDEANKEVEHWERVHELKAFAYKQ